MSERNRILVPLVGPEIGDKTLEMVGRFLGPSDSELLLLHVANRPQAAGIATGNTGEKILAAKRSNPLLGGPGRTLPTASPSGVERSSEEERVATPAQVEESERRKLAAEYDSLARELRGKGYEVSVRIRFGDVGEEIVKQSEAEDVDLIAMETRGRTGLSRLVSGSAADRVLQNVPVPVLLVHAD